MKSGTLGIYKKFLESSSQEAIEFVDSVYAFCEEHYDAGGDNVVECMEPSEVVDEFSNLDEVKAYIGIKIEQELNCRWGEDDDPQVSRYERFKDI